MYKIISKIKAHVYYFIRCLLTQEIRSAVKRMLTTSRKRFSRIYLLAFGKYTAKELAKELKKRAIEDFDVLMVHSSWDHLLPMYSGTPQDLIDELLAFCGEGRTLVMPAFFLGGRAYDTKEYYRSHVFDVRKTVSEMGLLTEIFRRVPGVKRSLHPTHSICAFGPLAEELTATHHLASTRTGKSTPFEIMARKRTVILGLGVEYYRSLAQTHTAEDMLGCDFPVKFHRETFPVSLIDYHGNELIYSLTILKSSRTLDNSLLRSLLRADELIEWRFHGTALFVTFAQRVTSCLLVAAGRGVTVYGNSVRAKDPV